jgi:uracil-DNA glycosylase
MLNIETGWKKLLKKEFKEDYFIQLTKLVDEEYKKKICFPKFDLIFNSFNSCPYKSLKIVVLGQDPYHGRGQADGLAFSISNNSKTPPSLKNILKEVSIDLKVKISKDTNLQRWASQGVLLLNTILSVRHGEPMSHSEFGWKKFTSIVIKSISENNSSIVFLLWGSLAIKQKGFIDESRNLVLTSGHPSPLSANRGYWFNNKHFSNTNSYLTLNNKQPIDW